jgi:hypothetical protein
MVSQGHELRHAAQVVAPEKRKSDENVGDDPATDKPVEKADTTSEPVETDFAAALMMLAQLPLSDEL